MDLDLHFIIMKCLVNWNKHFETNSNISVKKIKKQHDKREMVSGTDDQKHGIGVEYSIHENLQMRQKQWRTHTVSLANNNTPETIMIIKLWFTMLEL